MLRRLLALACLLVASCSSAPTGSDAAEGLRLRYMMLEGESKALFMAFYSWLTPHQRRAWLEGQQLVTRDPEHRAAALGRIAENYPESDRKALLPRMEAALDEPLKHRPKALEIVVKDEAGKQKVGAVLVYEKGRSAEAKVEEGLALELQPELGRVKGNVIEMGCAATDVVLYARFLNAYSSSKVLSPRKRVSSLDIATEGAWRGKGNPPGELQLRLKARCEDGTANDVSCLSSWKVLTVTPGDLPLPKIEGCGRLTGVVSGAQVRIAAKYGPSIAESTITIP